jgi:hypothetical protein
MSKLDCVVAALLQDGFEPKVVALIRSYEEQGYINHVSYDPEEKWVVLSHDDGDVQYVNIRGESEWV